MAKVDLHIHSTFSSDGEFTPAELVEIAKSEGLSAIAITDHNTTAGCGAALQAGQAAGIEIIPAVELDCIFQDIEFHLLGYFLDHQSEKIARYFDNIREQELLVARERVRLVNAAGIEIDLAEAQSRANDVFITGEIIAEIVLNKPNSAANPLLRPFLPGGARSDNPYVNFYWDYCAQGKPAFVPIKYISMVEAIALIRELGGIPCLSHPGANLKGRFDLLEGIVALGMQGIEVYNNYHSPEEVCYFAAKAREYGLAITCGSDFHGKTKPAIRMGQYGYDGDGLDFLARLKRLRPAY